jgi:hypothetical protein
MKQKTRIYDTETQKAMMWERWKKGKSLHQIAQLFDRNYSSIRRILGETGGIGPAERHFLALGINLGRARGNVAFTGAGYSIRAIAGLLKRAPSTISREISRNGGQERYRARQADQAAWSRSHRPETCKLAGNRALPHIVAGKLRLNGSVNLLRRAVESRLEIGPIPMAGVGNREEADGHPRCH